MGYKKETIPESVRDQQVSTYQSWTLDGSIACFLIGAIIYTLSSFVIQPLGFDTAGMVLIYLCGLLYLMSAGLFATTLIYKTKRSAF